MGALGIVYGDIGTSPLYAFRAAIKPKSHARTFIAAEHPSQLGCG